MKRYLVAIATLSAWAVACDDEPKSHVYLAMVYEAARDCVDPSASLATIDTSEGSLACAPTCLVVTSPPAAGAAQVYVSTMCGPYPSNLDKSQTSALCPAALAAFARGPDTCNADGTSSNPVPDAGSSAVDAAAAADARGDDGGALDGPTE